MYFTRKYLRCLYFLSNFHVNLNIPSEVIKQGNKRKVTILLSFYTFKFGLRSLNKNISTLGNKSQKFQRYTDPFTIINVICFFKWMHRIMWKQIDQKSIITQFLVNPRSTRTRFSNTCALPNALKFHNSFQVYQFNQPSKGSKCYLQKFSKNVICLTFVLNLSFLLSKELFLLKRP